MRDDPHFPHMTVGAKYGGVSLFYPIYPTHDTGARSGKLAETSHLKKEGRCTG